MDDDLEFARIRRQATIRVQIMRNHQYPPRQADLYLLEEPHVHFQDHCCPYAAHNHHGPVCDPAWCRHY